jgi:EAL domain-containing protein (putative c-di-GMP-specific phosphodiesterase class I)
MSATPQLNINVHPSPDADSANELSCIFEDRSMALGHNATNSVPDILHAIRQHLKMEVAFVAEFVNDQRIFRYVDSTWTKNPVHVGGGGPLDESYCQRVVDGRLPELLNDARANPVAAELPATFDIPVGAHMSVPIHLSDGSIYGTFCCFSRGADTSLNLRDLSLMRMLAELAGKMIDRERHSIVHHRASTERVRKVLSSDAIHIVYQPIFDLNLGAIAGFESLSRFSATPARSPDLWFNEAHAVGLGIELELKAIQLAMLVMPNLCTGLDLSINASPETILDPRFETLLSTLPSVEHLVLEITEHAAVEKYEEIAQQLKPYRDNGLQLAVDDAGAGYASFRHILNLEPDRIKLDMSLTRDIDVDPARRALAAALIHFSADTGSKLVAEGVETAGEAAALIELGVENAQGYFLGRPMNLAGLQHLGCLRSVMALNNAPQHRVSTKPA